MNLGKVYRQPEGYVVPYAYDKELQSFKCVIVKGREEEIGRSIYVPKEVAENSFLAREVEIEIKENPSK